MQEKSSPLELKTDGSFWLIAEDKKGNWYIDTKDDDAIILKMDWEKNRGYATWEFLEISESSIKLKCVDSTWGRYVDTYLESTDSEQTGEVIPMTLKSHPGKALVVDSERNYMHENYPIRWFKLGEAKDALKCVFKKTASGYFVWLDNERTHQFDVASGKYEEGNEVLSWRRHYGGNQLFIVFEDKTIAP